MEKLKAIALGILNNHIVATFYKNTHTYEYI